MLVEDGKRPGYLDLCHSGHICKGKGNASHLQPHPGRQAAQSGPEQRWREELRGSVPEEVPGEAIWVSLRGPSGRECYCGAELLCHLCQPQLAKESFLTDSRFKITKTITAD